MPIRIRKVWLATYLAGLATLAVAQETQNLDAWYAYPFSVGAAYESVTPFAAYRSAFDLYDLSAKARLPLPGRPVLQPSLQVGLLQFSPRSTDQTWAHRDLYGLLGADWSLRFSKTFELGAGFAGGASLSLFDQLLPGAGTVATPNLYFLASAKLALVPAFNFALEFTPTLGYIQSLGPLSDFDGLVLGLGLSAHVRLGEDPDAPKAALDGSKLKLNLGFSHDVEFPVPTGITVTVEKNTHLTVTGHDRQQVGQVAAQIRAYRKCEPYKGKGVKYSDETVVRKAGKAAK